MELKRNKDDKFILRTSNNNLVAEFTNYGEFDNYVGITLSTEHGAYLFTKTATPREYKAWCGGFRATIHVEFDSMFLTWDLSKATKKKMAACLANVSEYNTCAECCFDPCRVTGK